MPEYLSIEFKLQERFPGLAAQIIRFSDVEIFREKPELEAYKGEIANSVKTRWAVEELKDDPVFRAYRDFFWKLGIDPTKNRPAAEALIRRVLRDRPVPKINTWVDAYNLVSIETAVPIASFDSDLLEGDLLMREAVEGEEFLGIAMKKPVVLKGGEAVIEDGERLVAIYPYRDADYSKVSMNTRNVLMLMCGAPGITLDYLEKSSLTAADVLTRFCGGAAT
ncbi:MAG: phenylalanine--tRNA ligase beta subunit-related protein [Candidatus Bathyarchaeota archaeon]|nr:phenylalanine--tRNA ligase beta subunit-related protein [Candidatus Bathyarchaeota archaeon]